MYLFSCLEKRKITLSSIVKDRKNRQQIQKRFTKYNVKGIWKT